MTVLFVTERDIHQHEKINLHKANNVERGKPIYSEGIT